MTTKRKEWKKGCQEKVQSRNTPDFHLISRCPRLLRRANLLKSKVPNRGLDFKSSRKGPKSWLMLSLVGCRFLHNTFTAARSAAMLCRLCPYRRAHRLGHWSTNALQTAAVRWLSKGLWCGPLAKPKHTKSMK